MPAVINSSVDATITGVWRVTPNFDLCWREWDGECIVYHTGTADTHYIDAVGAIILKYLEQGDASANDVVGHLGPYFLDTEEISGQDLEKTFVRHLQGYRTLGLSEQFLYSGK